MAVPGSAKSRALAKVQVLAPAVYQPGVLPEEGNSTRTELPSKSVERVLTVSVASMVRGSGYVFQLIILF